VEPFPPPPPPLPPEPREGVGTRFLEIPPPEEPSLVIDFIA